MIPHDALMSLVFFVYAIIGVLIYTAVCDDDDSFGLLFMMILFWPIPVVFSIICIVVELLCIPFVAAHELIKKTKNKNSSNE